MPSRRVLPVVLVLALPLLAGCQSFGFTSVSDTMYPTLEKAQESADAAKIPQLVPDDARSIRVAYDTEEGGQVMSFTSAGGLTDDGCREARASGEPAFTPGWWPAEQLPADGWACGDWTVVADGDRYLVLD